MNVNHAGVGLKKLLRERVDWCPYDHRDLELAADPFLDHLENSWINQTENARDLKRRCRLTIGYDPSLVAIVPEEMLQTTTRLTDKELPRTFPRVYPENLVVIAARRVSTSRFAWDMAINFSAAVRAVESGLRIRVHCPSSFLGIPRGPPREIHYHP